MQDGYFAVDTHDSRWKVVSLSRESVDRRRIETLEILFYYDQFLVLKISVLEEEKLLHYPDRHQ